MTCGWSRGSRFVKLVVSGAIPANSRIAQPLRFDGRFMSQEIFRKAAFEHLADGLEGAQHA